MFRSSAYATVGTSNSIPTTTLMLATPRRVPSLARALNFIKENFAEELDLEILATQSNMSRFHLCRAFKKKYGKSPMKWLWMFRAYVSQEFISQAPHLSVTDVAFASGFTSSAHFSRFFHSVVGMSPSAYKKREQLAKARRSTELVESKVIAYCLYNKEAAVIAALKKMERSI